MLVQVEQLVWPTLSHQIRHKLSLHYPTELCTLHLYIFYNIDLRSAIAIITAHKKCTRLTHVKLNTDTKQCHVDGHVEGLVCPEDNILI